VQQHVVLAVSNYVLFVQPQHHSLYDNSLITYDYITWNMVIYYMIMLQLLCTAAEILLLGRIKL
jgi:hypothetical protein